MQTSAGQRLKEARTHLGLTFRDFAFPLGVTHSAVAEWEKGISSKLSKVHTIAIQQVHGISANWLLTGKGTMMATGKTPQINKGLVSISLRSLRHSQNADSGARLLFEESWLVSRVGTTENLFLATVDGDSMAPTLNPGDLVMVDSSATGEDFVDGVWVFKIGHVIHLKRLWQLGPGHFEAKGDNCVYGAITLNKLPEIVGKVVWSDRRW